MLIIKGHINQCSGCNGIICIECDQIHECNEYFICQNCKSPMKFYAKIEPSSRNKE